MSARDFIENVILRECKQYFGSAVIIAALIEANRHKWDKPDTGVVNEEAFDKAAYQVYGRSTLYPLEEVNRAFLVVQAYEAAKLNKVMEGSGKGSARAETDSMEAAQPSTKMPELPVIAWDKIRINGNPTEGRLFIDGEYQMTLPLGFLKLLDTLIAICERVK